MFQQILSTLAGSQVLVNFLNRQQPDPGLLGFCFVFVFRSQCFNDTAYNGSSSAKIFCISSSVFIFCTSNVHDPLLKELQKRSYRFFAGPQHPLICEEPQYSRLQNLFICFEAGIYIQLSSLRQSVQPLSCIKLHLLLSHHIILSSC